jgi:formate hydrogenlyase subunit 6/NADH:ubiquinone oxidoreductase subunit I
MFCSLCVPPCPTDCIHMGDMHDMSGYDRKAMVVEFTDLARDGHQTVQPLWMQKDKLPAWAADRKQRWIDRASPARQQMLEALEESKPAKKPEAAKTPAPPKKGPADAKGEGA